MNIVQNFLNINPYSLKKKDKLKQFSNYINRLTLHHYKNCEIYKKIINDWEYFGKDDPFGDFELLFIVTKKLFI